MTSAPAIKLLLRRLLAADSPAERFRAGRELARTVWRLPRPKRADLEKHLGDLLGVGMIGAGDGSLFSGSFLNPAGGLLADLVSRAGSGERIKWRHAAEELIDRVLAEEESPGPPPPPAPQENQTPAEDDGATVNESRSGLDVPGRETDTAVGEGAASPAGLPRGTSTSGSEEPLGAARPVETESSAGTVSAAGTQSAAGTVSAAGTESAAGTASSTGIEDPTKTKRSAGIESEHPPAIVPKMSSAARAAAVGAPFSVAFVDPKRIAPEVRSTGAQGRDEAESAPSPEVDPNSARGANSIPAREADSGSARGANSIPAREADPSSARGANSIPAREADSSSARGAVSFSEGGSDSKVEQRGDSFLPRDVRSASRHGAGLSPAAGIRRFVAGAPRWDSATRRRELTALPAWAARRALCAAIRSAGLTEPEEIIELIAAIDSAAARHWCLGELLATHALDGALLDRALELASPPARRRLRARYRRMRVSRGAAC